MGVQEFRLEVAFRDGLTALRRFGWLMLLVMLADGGFEIGTRLLLEHWQFLGTDWTFAAVAIWAGQRLATASTAATIYLLAMTGARGEPLRPLTLLRRLSSCLPIIILADAVFILPGEVASLFFQDNTVALRAVRFAAGLYHLGMFLSLGLVIPVILDRGLTLSAGVAQGLALIRGRRWPLFLMVLAPSLVMGGVRMAMGDVDPLRQVQQVWFLYLLNYAIYGFALLAIAATYLESAPVNGAEREELAETFA
ncbi:hypothetical protein [Caulobacter sp. NIBR1757]|uniref:hypothetical protein n=1 Tax=Caulobacter sp. NIBR1757 TaxID=3016000 RepID=UPI0022F13899|nr:hypothetical protein [Caulobacter sp. NIBR1757]WGM39847.1 hypothetical protein AMEJIAPC_02787 [Caulobacter sp. NIBR1757]